MKACFPLLLLLCLSSTSVRADMPNYQLVWSDEFNQDGRLDDKDWSFEAGFVRNMELQWYQSENAWVENGFLIIEARRETILNPNFSEDSSDWKTDRRVAYYSSASVNTKNRHSWLYGRFEIRARLQAEAGLWPAIWFLGIQGKWPANGEIDLMEFYQGDILANAAWATLAPTGIKPEWDTVKTPVSSFESADWSSQFHTWRMDWDTEFIRLYIDGRLLNTIDVQAASNPDGISPKFPFRQPHFLLLNLAIGGTQGGNPDATPFPTRFEVDYVRVYQSQIEE